MLLPAYLLVAVRLSSAGSGAISMADLCAELSQVTGESHEITAPFLDHSLYLRLKNPTPERLRDLSAESLRGEWVHKGKRWQLIAGKAPEMPDWFPAAWTKAYDPNGKMTGAAPDPKRLYALRVGDQELNGDKIIRRLLGTMYEWGQTQWAVENPLTDVMAWLGDRKDKVVKVPKSTKPKPRMGGSSLSAGTERWKKSGPDVLAKRSSELLAAVADTLGGDVAFPIPDGLAAAGFFFETDQPLGQSLKSLSQWMEFRIDSDMLVGQLTAADAGARTQANRNVLINGSNPMPDFFDTPVLAKFEADQPTLASLAVNDLIGLIMGGASVDATPHYPWDMRLYRNLSNADWATVRQKEATVGDLSAAARASLNILASKSRMFNELHIPLENGSIPDSTPITLAETSDDPLVVYYGDRTPEIMDSLNVASHRIWTGYNDKAARFLPIHRRLLTLVVGENFRIPYTKVELPSDRTPVRYSQLPSALRETIANLEKSQRDQRRQQVPPPVF